MADGRRVLGDPRRLDPLVATCEALPEAETSGDQHVAFRVRAKAFAYYQDDHHGDGIVGLVCMSTPARQHELVERHPDRDFRPGYLGARGWIGIRLDLPEVDWDEVEGLVVAAYRLQAPKRLLDLLG